MAYDFQTSSSSSCYYSSSSESESPTVKTNPHGYTARPAINSVAVDDYDVSPENEEEGSESDGFDTAWRRRVVMLEGYVDSRDGSEDGLDGVGRTKSLTGDDLEELKGCLDLGFGFSYDEIPELCGTLPALELCYSLSQRFLDEEQQRTPASASKVEGEKQQSLPGAAAVAAPLVEKPNTNWRISGPGDDPEEVKARLKYWAQAVACTVKLCS